MKAYFAGGCAKNLSAVLVICGSQEEAIEEKERLKHSDCIRVSYTPGKRNIRKMMKDFRKRFKQLTIRDLRR